VTRVCRACLGDLREPGEYHARCVRRLFGSTKVPRLDIELAKLHTAALAMVGRTSLSGVQKKLSVNLSTDREMLQVAAGKGRYILKVQSDSYPALPENEHLTTRLAQLVEIQVAPFGLVPLREGSLAYVVRRFDRLPDGRKLRQEDFCQLAGLSPKEKYDSTAERCVKLVQQYASEPLITTLELYRLLVFTWWSGNGDMHLKNFSLLTDDQWIIRLTPAYDLLCTQLVIPEDPLALPVCGKRDNLDRDTWLQLAKYAGLSEKAASRVLDRQSAVAAEAASFIDRSFLPAEMKMQYGHLIEERTKRLGSSTDRAV